MDYIELDCIVKPKDPFSDVLMSALGAIGFDMFEEHEKGIKAYIRSDLFTEASLNEIEYFGENEYCIVSWCKKTIKQKNWNREWESNFEPVTIAGQILVRAAFHPSQPGYRYQMVIQPKMSFGTGHHETTSLMMSRMLTLDFKNKIILDMGCGSGILAILAGMLGAATIWAVDTDSNATENAIENCNINGLQTVHVVTGGAESITGHSFDIILANINRNILLDQIHTYSASLSLHGMLILSGFYLDDIPVLLKEAENHNLKLNAQSTDNKWCELSFIKK